MINEKAVLELIDQSEKRFRECWRILATLKCYNPSKSSISGEIVNFQPLLAKALFEIQKALNAINISRNELIAKKTALNRESFLKEIRQLADFEYALNDAEKLGKAIGDAFAWFFYHKNRDLLFQHLEHEPITHFASGIGGIGELCFTERIHNYEGKLALYHGTTSILRHGDVSFIDLGTLKVVAIGEIKSKPIGPNKLELSLVTVGPDLLNAFPNVRRATGNENNSSVVPQGRTADRLKRQLKAAESAFQKATDKIYKEDIRNLNGSYINAVSRISKDCIDEKYSFEIVGDSLILAGIRIKTMPLSSKLLGSSVQENFTSKLGDLNKKILGISIKGSNFNSIFLGHLDANGFLVGTIPMFWWPLDLKTLEDIYFQDLIISTIFNPSHLIERLQSKGFDITKTDKRPGFRVSRKCGALTMVLENFEYFLNLIKGCLWSIEAVESLIESTANGAIDKSVHDHTGNVRVNLRIVQEPGIHFEKVA